jgi:hypothetical protein
MVHVPARSPQRSRTLLTTLIAGLIVLLTATSASAAGPGRYGIVGSSNGHYVTLSQNNLVIDEEHNDDELFFLSTSGSGANRLPFALGLYNQWYRRIAISTNGHIQLGVTSRLTDDDFQNDCLYSTRLQVPAIFPFWDDLVFHPGDTSLGFPQGVFVKTLGRAPHRTFIVAWQGVQFVQPTDPPGEVVKAQALFREGSQNVTFVYGTSGGGSATIGVQSTTTVHRWTQYACNTGDPETVTNGLQLGFVRVNP